MAVRTIAAGLAVALTVGCDSPDAKKSCTTDDMCGNGVCVQKTCLMRPLGRTVAVEVVPTSASLSVKTEILNVLVSDAPLALSADNKAAIMGTVTSSSLFSMEAHVAIGIPSRIEGRPDLQLIAEMAQNQFGFTVPNARVGINTTASFLFLPGNMLQTQPPVPLTAPLTPTLSLTFPSSTQMTFVRGQLVDASGRPLGGDSYPARVSFKGVSVSNVRPPDVPTGAFTLLVPPGATSDAPDDQVQVTFGTADNPDNLPVLIAAKTSLSRLGTPAGSVVPARIYTMPPFLPAAAVTTRVVAVEEGESTAQPNVTVRMWTDIPAPDGGMAHYERSAVTDSHGVAMIPIIPVHGAPLPYQVSIKCRTTLCFRTPPSARLSYCRSRSALARRFRIQCPSFCSRSWS